MIKASKFLDNEIKTNVKTEQFSFTFQKVRFRICFHKSKMSDVENLTPEKSVLVFSALKLKLPPFSRSFFVILKLVCFLRYPAFLFLIFF